MGLANTPSMSATSRLYGQPAWWGEVEGPHTPSHAEFKHTPPGSQLLRDFDSDDAASSMSSSRSSKLSTKDGLRLKAISNSHEQSSSNSSWVVDFNPSSKSRPISKQRPRSADPSPVRTSPTNITTSSTASSLSRKSQSTFVKRQSPVSTREVSGKVIATRPHSSSLTRSATTRKTTPNSPQRTRKSSLNATTRRKSGSLSDITSSKTPDGKEHPNAKQPVIDSKTRRKSGSLSNISSKPSDNVHAKSAAKTGSTGGKIDSKTRKKSGSMYDIAGKSQRVAVEKTYTKIGGQGSTDELQTSISDVSLTSDVEPVVVGEGPGCVGEDRGTEGTARKQWNKELPVSVFSM